VLSFSYSQIYYVFILEFLALYGLFVVWGAAAVSDMALVYSSLYQRS